MEKQGQGKSAVEAEIRGARVPEMGWKYLRAKVEGRTLVLPSLTSKKAEKMGRRSDLYAEFK